MTLDELKHVAVLSPSIFGWYYNEGRDRVVQKLHEIDKCIKKDGRVKTTDYFAIVKMTFGQLCCALDFGLINNKQFLGLTSMLDKLNLDKCEDSFQKIVNINAITNVSLREITMDVDDWREELKSSMNDNRLCIFAREKVKEGIDNASDASLEEKRIASAKRRMADLCNEYIDNDVDVVFKMPEHLGAITSEVGNEYGNIITCAIHAPSEVFCFYNFQSARRRIRLNKLVELNAPDVIIYNERRMWSDMAIFCAIAAGVINNDLEWNDTLELFDKFLEKRKNCIVETDEEAAEKRESLMNACLDIQLFVESALDKFGVQDFRETNKELEEIMEKQRKEFEAKVDRKMEKDGYK